MAKKIGFGVALWLIGFILYSGVIVLPLAAIFQWIIFIVLSAIVTYILAMVFFKKHPGDIKAGAVLGLLWVIVGVAIDWAVVGIMAVSGQVNPTQVVGDLYSQIWFYLNLALVIVVAGVAGHLTHGGQLAPTNPQAPTQQPPQMPMR